MSEETESVIGTSEEVLNSKSKARQDIIDRINNADFTNFDVRPWKDPNSFRPIPGKQEQFIMSDARITIYSGGSGTGKSEALVLDQLRHVHDPNYESVTFRRNTKSLKGAGGIFNKAGKVYKKLGAEQKLQDLRYDWPSGATSRYSHMEHGRSTAEEDHAGLEYASVYFDELHLFDKESFMFMLSRLRTNADMQPYIKATCNPAPKESIGGWLHEFLEGFYIDEYGYPIEENSGKIRYFITADDGRFVWADTKEELQVRYGFDCDPMSFTCITSTIIDNPVLCHLQPSYLQSLRNMGRIERERLLYTCWNVAPKGTGYFKREWVEFVDHADVPKRIKTVRGWDIAASVASELNSDPDFTASVRMSLCEDGYFYVENVDEFRARPAGVADAMLKTAIADSKNVPIVLPVDPGSAGLIAHQHLARPLILKGFKIKKERNSKSKLDRFSGFSNAAENGLVKIVRGNWNDSFISQLENFDPSRRRQHDDQLDATSSAYNYLTSGKKSIEKFKMNPASLTKANQFGGF